MINIVDDFNPPSCGISGDRKWGLFHYVYDCAELVRFPGFNLRSASFSVLRQGFASICIDTYPFYSVSSPERSYFPLVVVRYTDPRLRMWTYEPVSLLKVSGRAAAYGPRVLLDIDPGFSENVLDLINPCLQFSILEDGRGVAGWSLGHGW